MEKGIFVKEIKPGLKVTGIFILLNPALTNSSRGPFWKFSLADATGSIPGKIWYPKSMEYESIPAGVPMEASGTASLFSGQLQLTVEYLEVPENDSKIDKSWFMPVSPVPIDEMFQELRQLCLSEFSHKPWRKFILSLLDDEKIGKAFREAPAAKNIHQAYLGGLLEHSLNVARICISIADNYPELDKQTLLAAAICHDMGKIREYSWDVNIATTDQGDLLGHLYMGLEILSPKLNASGLEPELIEHFKHLVLSHHGQYEFGSPRLPQTAEAFALHFADNIDAKLAQCREAETVAATGWTDRQWSLGRRIFKPVHTPEKEKNEPRSNQECLLLLKE